MSTPENNTKPEANGEQKAPESKVPEWLKVELFEDVLKQTVPGYKKVRDFKAKSALPPGENYATIMLRVEIEVELEDEKVKSISYMLKLAHDNEMFREFMKRHNIFDVERGMYLDVVPELENMYREAGIDVKFGAQCYKLPIDRNHVLLEDLCIRGFKNTNRLEGLDMEHTKCVLKKLAQWHAASATRVENKGRYDDIFTYGFFKEEQKEMMKNMNDMMGKTILKGVKLLSGNENYIESVEKLIPNITDELQKSAKIDPNEFNVLNHGDCWSNNVMFQYDAFGKIKETFLVDYQIAKYGTPAQDLFYFLISSTKLEIKLKQFEYLVKYYHDELIEHLQLLKYPKKLPTLKDIHSALYKHGIWGYSTVTGVMAAVLVDPTENASMENFISDSAEGTDFKMLMYTNQRYRKHAEAILPWLHNRGALEC